MKDIREYLKEKNLLFDGAMGTYFAKISHKSASESEEAALKNADIIEKIHREYIDAGAKAIKTDTFAAAGYENGNEIIRAAYKAAKRAAEGRGVYIFADMGPIGSECKAKELYAKAADEFLRLGAENFLFETLSEASAVCEAAEYIKEKRPDAFIIASFAVGNGGYTNTGRHISDLLSETDSCGAIDAAGMNCGAGPGVLLKILEKIEAKKPVSIMPNAGYPTVIGSRAVYGDSEEYFAEKMARIVSSGARIAGGCCGTTPLFIKSCLEAGIEKIEFGEKENRNGEFGERKRRYGPFYEKLLRGEKAIAVELDPPEDIDRGFFMTGAAKIIDAGADAITIADCPVARPRMDSAILSCKLKRELGIEAIPHMTCRDRNLNATKAVLLALSSEGVGNVLAVTGDPLPSAARDEVKSVFNFNSRMLISFVKSLNENVFASPTCICAALNVNAKNFSVQLKLALEKEKNGAMVFFTQPVMTKEALANLKEAKNVLKSKIMCGIMPVVSKRNALFMNAEIAGIRVDEKIISLFEGKTRDEAEEVGKMVALKVFESAKDWCDGFYIITPFKRVAMICEIVREIKKNT